MRPGSGRSVAAQGTAYDRDVDLHLPPAPVPTKAPRSAGGNRSGPLARWVFLAAVLAQSALVITGGLVRLTGSGLGCPTWPQCATGSYVPVQHQAQGFHSLIEFGNRLLTFVLLVVVAASIVAAWRQRPRRRPLVLLALAGLLGVLAQAVLGGITVLTGLNPYLVASHLLLSMLLIAAAVVLHRRSGEDGDGRVQRLVRPELVWTGRAVLALAAVVVVLGTVVTGSGPHSGDPDARARFGLDPRSVSWLHADVVIAFVGVTIALWLALRLTDGPAPAQRATGILLAVSLAQGVVGYVQYFTGLPELVVALHLVGACAVWVASVRVVLALRVRTADAAP